MPEAVNLAEKLALFDERWSPKIVGHFAQLGASEGRPMADRRAAAPGRGGRSPAVPHQGLGSVQC
jgi:hypothetical protein